jgi:hypothetical protein
LCQGEDGGVQLVMSLHVPSPQAWSQGS